MKQTAEMFYIHLPIVPASPAQKLPNFKECAGYEFITMVQFCDIAGSNGLNRHASDNAFGGDRGKYPVEPARMTRAAYAGKQLRKFILVSAAADYFHEKGVRW